MMKTRSGLVIGEDIASKQKVAIKIVSEFMNTWQKFGGRKKKSSFAVKNQERVN